MKAQRRFLPQVFILIIVFLSAQPAIFAGDDGFKKIVKHIETDYNARHKRIPFLGLAGFIVKIIRPAGVKNFKLAIFEDQDLSRNHSGVDFSTVVRSALNREWQPMIRIYSRENGGWTYIYAKVKGKDIEFLVATLTRRDAVVFQAKLNPQTLVKWLEKPDSMGGLLATNIRKDLSIFGRSDRGPDVYPSQSTSDRGDTEQIAISVRATSTQVDKDDGPQTADRRDGQMVSVSARSAPVLRGRTNDYAGHGERELGLKNEQPASPATLQPTPDEKSDLKLEGRLVNLNVKATDRTGKIIPDLRKEDFLVFEDDVQQEVAYFEPITAPVNLVLLLDLSGSTKDKMGVMKKAAKKFIDALNKNDRVAVAGFTSRFFVVSNFTTDHKLLKDRIDDMKNRHAGTRYYEAMWATLDLLDQIKETRKAIVVLTDGVDNWLSNPRRFTTKYTFDDLQARLEKEEVTIYPIYLDTEYDIVVKQRQDSHETYAIARKQLEAVADQTGGMLFRASRVEDLEGVYRRVASELHTFYSLAYAPNNPQNNGQWRKISVKVSRDGAVARTRRGYFAK